MIYLNGKREQAMIISESTIRRIIREELQQTVSEGFMDSIKGFFKGPDAPSSPARASGLSSLIPETDGLRLFGIRPDALIGAVGRGPSLIGDTAPARLHLSLGSGAVEFSIMGSESVSMSRKLRANFAKPGSGAELALLPPERKRHEYPSGFSGSIRIDTPRLMQLDPKFERAAIARLGFDFDAWSSYTSNLGPRRKFDELQKLHVLRAALEAIRIAHKRVLDCFEATEVHELFRKRL